MQFIRVCAGLALAAVACGAAVADGDDAGQWIPTGQRIAPTAATGAMFRELDPGLPDFPEFRVGQAVTTRISHDGRTLLVLTSGFNLLADATGKGKAHSSEYVFVFDIAQRGPRQVQVVTVPNTDAGLVFAPDDSRFYVSGGVDDCVHVFARGPKGWAEEGKPIALGHRKGLGIEVKPSAAGIDITGDGKKLLVADRYNDAVTLVDPATRLVTGELDLRPGVIDPRKHGVPGGEYPDWVAIKGNTIAYASSQRDHEVDVVDVSGPPKLVRRIPVAGTPNRMVLNKHQSQLFVASDNTDTVTVIDTATSRIGEVIDASAPPGLLAGDTHFRGAAPDGLALSPDEQMLCVTLGGENALAVIPLSGRGPHHVAGLIPTG